MLYIVTFFPFVIPRLSFLQSEKNEKNPVADTTITMNIIGHNHNKPQIQFLATFQTQHHINGGIVLNSAFLQLGIVHETNAREAQPHLMRWDPFRVLNF
jgi:hypothetical protein